MAEVPIPLTDEEIDTSEGTGALVTVGLVIVGFMILAVARGMGSALAGQFNSLIASATGIDPTSGESTSAEVV